MTLSAARALRRPASGPAGNGRSQPLEVWQYGRAGAIEWVEGLAAPG